MVLDMIPMNQRDASGLMNTFKGIARRVVAISSQDVYRAYDIVRGVHPGPPDPVPLAEDASLRERLYPYEREGVKDYEKILVEKEVMAHPDLPSTILRLPMVYGPGDDQHRLFPYLKRMDDKRPAILLQENMASWRWTAGYVEDVAAAITLAATDRRAAGCIYNVGEEAPLPWSSWVREIGRAADWSGEVVTVPDEKLPENLKSDLNASQSLVTDSDRIRQELGYKETVPRQEALRRTVEWERANLPEEVDPKDFDYAAEDAVLETL